jgi:ribosomal-protein-alanine N-acetyltransferase
MLEVRPSNVAAVALYEKMGFNEIGVRRNYYPAGEGREDALLLALSLEG